MVGLLRDEPRPEPAPAVEPVTTAPPAGIVPPPRKRPEAAAAKPASSPAVAVEPAALPAEKLASAKDAKPDRPRVEPSADKRADAPGFQQGPRPDLTKPSSFSPAY
jgi:hypothetical protein